MSAAPYPWLAPVWERLLGSQADARLAHALLISGVPGLGRRALAEALTERILCREGRACGDCPPCHWHGAGNHPDLHVLAPLEDKTTIAVEQIRELIAKLALSPLAGGRKVAIIDPADAMTEAAANCLLKTLEEPAGDSVLMLVADRRVPMAATIRSRCQSAALRVPDTPSALAWLRGQDADADWPVLLRLAGGAPLTALALREDDFVAATKTLEEDLAALWKGQRDPSSVAERWLKLGGPRCVEWLADRVGDVIRVNSGVAEPELAHSLSTRGLPQALRKIKLNHLFNYLDAVREGRRRLDTPLNSQLILESLLIPWAGGFEAPAPR